MFCKIDDHIYRENYDEEPYDPWVDSGEKYQEEVKQLYSLILTLSESEHTILVGELKKQEGFRKFGYPEQRFDDMLIYIRNSMEIIKDAEFGPELGAMRIGEISEEQRLDELKLELDSWMATKEGETDETRVKSINEKIGKICRELHLLTSMSSPMAYLASKALQEKHKEWIFFSKDKKERGKQIIRITEEVWQKQMDDELHEFGMSLREKLENEVNLSRNADLGKLRRI